MKNTILVYAFSSWGKNNSNISEQILSKLDLPVDKLVLKVRFDKQVFRDILNKGYAYIVGLGQYPSGDLIRIERIAHNMYGSKSKGYQPIDNGSTHLETDLELIPTSSSILSYDAGKFLCNYSMYVILSEKQNRQKFAFLHIPKNLDLNTAIAVVQEILGQVV